MPAADGIRTSTLKHNDHSRAADAFASEIEAFLGFMSLERGLAANTIVSYRRDLDQAAEFLAREGASGWATVTAAQAPSRPT